MRLLGEVALAATVALLGRSDGTTDAARIATALDTLRVEGRHAAPAAEGLAALLPHRSRLFEGRDKDLVIRLRAYILVTLSDIGVPDAARPALVDILAHVDERNNPAEVGAAARALRSLGERGREFAPYLLDALTSRLSVEEFSLQRFETQFPESEATTAQLELVRAIGSVSPAGDELRNALDWLIRDPDRDPRLVREARLVLARNAAASTGATARAGAIVSTAALERDSGPHAAIERAGGPPAAPPDARTLRHLDIHYTDHDGRGGTLHELFDRPVLVTFFYSRCQNSRKCSLAVSHLAALQRQLTQAGLSDRVRLLAISYEPQFDTPERINRFASDRGLLLGTNALGLQLDHRREKQLTDELESPVNFSAGWVNTHGVELSLIDAGGHVVRQYETTLWDNDQVVADVTSLLGTR
jgi:protein SCO1/2